MRHGGESPIIQLRRSLAHIPLKSRLLRSGDPPGIPHLAIRDLIWKSERRQFGRDLLDAFLKTGAVPSPARLAPNSDPQFTTLNPQAGNPTNARSQQSNQSGLPNHHSEYELLSLDASEERSRGSTRPRSLPVMTPSIYVGRSSTRHSAIAHDSSTRHPQSRPSATRTIPAIRNPRSPCLSVIANDFSPAAGYSRATAIFSIRACPYNVRIIPGHPQS